MSNFLYIITLVMIAVWLLGYFVFSLGAIVHLLLVIAVATLLLRMVRREKNY